MKSTRHFSTRQSGQIVSVLIVLLLIIGGGFWWLVSYRNSMRNEGRAFGRYVIERLAVKHDLNFLEASLGPQAKLDIAPSLRQDLISRLQQLGAPVGPPNVQGDVYFQSQFFEPRGSFSALLTYPTAAMRMDLAISHPVGRWQIDSIGLNNAVPPR
jgi:hypothetical protein